MMTVIPPGDMEDLKCEDCGGETFRLRQEVRDGRVLAFHTICAECGKRGRLGVEIKIQVKQEFTQFADMPGGEESTWVFSGGDQGQAAEGATQTFTVDPPGTPNDQTSHRGPHRLEDAEGEDDCPRGPRFHEGLLRPGYL